MIAITHSQENRFFRLIRYVRPYAFSFGLIIIFVFILVAAELANGWFFKEFINSIISKNFRACVIVFLIGLIINLIMSVCFYMRGLLVGNVSEKVGIDLKKELFQNILELPLAYFSDVHSGDLGSRLSNDVNLAKRGLGDNLVKLFSSPLLALAVLCYMFYVNWKLALVCACVSPLMFFAGKILGKLIRANGRSLQHSLGEANAFSQDAINGMLEIKGHKIESAILIKYTNICKTILRQALINNKLNSAMGGIANYIGFATYATLWGYGGFLAFAGKISVGDLMLFTRLLDRLLNPFTSLASSWADFQHSLAAAGRIFEIIDVRQHLRTAERAAFPETAVNDSQISEGGAPIEFNNVDFSYGDEKTLSGFSLELRPLEKFAIVGPSGSGKTTVLKLLMGFYKPQTGEILINNVNFEYIGEKNLSDLISFMPQEGFIFKGTIRDNIVFGKKNISEEQVIHAAKTAHAHDFIETFANKYDTDVGEHGLKLSVGQKQRIIIARTVLKDSPILLMDEPTSSLDSESENIITNAINNLTRNKTSIVIAHRLSTILSADRIGVLKDGRIIELGNHNELMGMDGYYKKLYNLQFNKN